MKNFIVKIRNKTGIFLYKNFYRPILFLIDPEKIHDRFLMVGQILGSNFLTKGITYIFMHYSNKKLEQNILGIKFKNPIGLAAGFDKDAQLTNILPNVGFGFEEVGSITAKPYTGNNGIRLFRLKKSQALIVNYGLKNKGANYIHNFLKKKKLKFPIGINIAPTNSKSNVNVENGVKDYLFSYKKFKDLGNYFTINLSCPNSYGGEQYTNSKLLDKLLKDISKIKKTKPVFLKISPDLKDKDVDKIIKVCDKYSVDGFIIGNLTKNRNNGRIIEKNIPKIGGISGKPCRDLSSNMIKYIYKETKGKYVIIGCGGIFNANDAYEKIKNGASLVQLITGMIYEGPFAISEINRELVQLLKRDNLKNISEAIGKYIDS